MIFGADLQKFTPSKVSGYTVHVFALYSITFIYKHLTLGLSEALNEIITF